MSRGPGSPTTKLLCWPIKVGAVVWKWCLCRALELRVANCSQSGSMQERSSGICHFLRISQSAEVVGQGEAYWIPLAAAAVALNQYAARRYIGLDSLAMYCFYPERGIAVGCGLAPYWMQVYNLEPLYVWQVSHPTVGFFNVY